MGKNQASSADHRAPWQGESAFGVTEALSFIQPFYVHRDLGDAGDNECKCFPSLRTLFLTQASSSGLLTERQTQIWS